MERWETIRECPDYEVSNLGRVRNKKTGRVLSAHDNNGYKRVKIGGKLQYVKRLVSDAFSEVDDHQDNYSQARVVMCKDCIHRYEYDICEDKDDYFYCGYGQM